MPSKPKPPTPQSANLSFGDMEGSIEKIDRRIAELDAFDVGSVTEHSDPKVLALSAKLDELLVLVFGHGTVEYEKYQWQVCYIDMAPMSTSEDTYPAEIQDGLRRGIAKSKAQLEAIKDGFQERLQDSGRDVSGKALKAYEGLQLHPVIEDAVGQMFRDGYYSNAVEVSVKALNDLVRLRSGVDKDGTQLMEHVFSPNNPLLKFNSLADQSDKDEQKGFMMLFCGSVTGLRNPRAHKIIKDDPERALEFIAFVSLLAKIVDEAKK